MKRGKQGKNAFDLIEEATHLLRTAPTGLLATYYIGAIPFILALLFFWADMSQNPFANAHLAEAALGVSALFVWMKFWQAVFARRVRAHFAAEPEAPLQWRPALRIAAAQITLQPLGLLPIGLCLAGFFYFTPVGLMLVPVIAALLPLFHNITALGDGGTLSMTAIFKKAWRLWWLWPRQNIVLLGILHFFALYVLINWSVLCLYLPSLIKTLFSIESVFSSSPMAMMNSTFIAAMCGLTYLCVDPILKTVYALRCFYGESVKSGEDLKAELKRFSFSPSAAALLVLALLLASATALNAANDATAENQPVSDAKLEAQNPPAAKASPAGKPAAISSPDLDQTINRTIHESKYTWRMPREKMSDSGDEGPIGRFMDKINELLKKCARTLLDWWERLTRKLFPRRASGSLGGGQGWMTTLQLLFFILLAVVICTLAIFIYRILQRRRQPNLVASEAIQPVPDVADENVGADQLPEDGWTKLARELLERGEFRLAMRAFYLASLAHLAQRNLISIARFKSNREYERELRRRGHSFPDLLSVFGDNLSVFEGIWYGLHDVNGETVTQFAANVDRMRGTG
jgi:uncharacterized membrane protein